MAFGMSGVLRIKTADGWKEIRAVIGPTGPTGPTGEMPSIAGETMPAFPSQSQLTDAVKLMFTAMGGEVK